MHLSCHTNKEHLLHASVGLKRKKTGAQNLFGITSKEERRKGIKFLSRVAEEEPEGKAKNHRTAAYRKVFCTMEKWNGKKAQRRRGKGTTRNKKEGKKTKEGNNATANFIGKHGGERAGKSELQNFA